MGNSLLSPGRKSLVMRLTINTEKVEIYSTKGLRPPIRTKLYKGLL
jgi:hypothetical protein